MGYVEKAMGTNERVVYTTHQHAIVLLERALSPLFVFAVFLAVGLVVLLSPATVAGDQRRFIVGVVALVSVVMPLYFVVRTWLAGKRGRELVQGIWRPGLAALLILTVALWLMFRPDLKALGWVALLVALVPFSEFVRLLMDWLNERYIITNRRVMEVRGIINKHVRDSALEKVNDVGLDQSMVGRVLGYGSVQIITGSDIGVNKFLRIRNPVRFKREMLNAKELAIGSGDREDRLASFSEPADNEIPELIADLDELRQRGILTEAEFQAKKQELLNRL